MLLYKRRGPIYKIAKLKTLKKNIRIELKWLS